MTRGDARWERRPGQIKFLMLVTVTSATTTAAATSAATTTTAVFTTRTAITAATSATRTLFFRTRDVDSQCALAKACAVHGLNRLLRFFGS